MANEYQRARLSQVRGRQAAQMKPGQAKDYIAASANMDQDFEPTLADTNTTTKNQNTAGNEKVLGSLKKGGKINKTGLYKLHKGEKVVPKNKAMKIGALMRAR